MKALAIETIYPGHGKPLPLYFALYENRSFVLVDYDVENSDFHHNRSIKHFLQSRQATLAAPPTRSA